MLSSTQLTRSCSKERATTSTYRGRIAATACPTIHVKPRDIIVRFISYRDLVYLNKKNLKSYNNNPSNNNRVLRHVNEVLTRTRAKLFAQTRRLHKEKFIAGCRIMDGRIKMKLLNGNIVTITREDELYRQVPDSDTKRVAIGLQISTLNRR